jgi:hypothetical protein
MLKSVENKVNHVVDLELPAQDQAHCVLIFGWDFRCIDQ